MSQPMLSATSPWPQLRPLIVIPTYNNASTLRGVAEACLQSDLPVLVVDDGSTDGGPETLNGLQLQVVRHERNRGKGAAIRTAVEWSAGKGFSHLITIDADGQHNPGDIPRLSKAAAAQPLAIVVGTRDFDNTEVPESSVFGRKFSNFWVRVSSGATVADSQSGFRVYPLVVLQRVKCRARRYNFEVEILVRSVWAGVELISVPVKVAYTPHTTAASHFRPVRDNFRISLTYSMLVLRNFFPWPHKILFGQTQHEKAINFILHPIKGFKSLATENSSPKQIALAVTVGIFLATLPLLAAHSVTIIFVATRLRLNRLIALNVSHLCAPPFVPALAVEAGYFLRNGRFLTEFNMQTLGYEALQRFWEYLLGAVALAPILALLAGGLAYLFASFWQSRRNPEAPTAGGDGGA